VTVARKDSITRASERLYLSQPAVSAHVKAIEDTLGLKVFERTPRGIRKRCGCFSRIAPTAPRIPR